MRILGLELKNIRSYKHEKIDFPKGIVLLSGDIGSGKSTLLLAIEFALFGVQRGQLSGSALLRHGTQEGMVRMRCSFGKEQITITRRLKRNANSVGQSAGSIVRNGVKTDLTAVELKAKILELLAYPDSLLSQHKSLVFRYTVYTPQEHMKTILFEKPEERLDTLRKLFAIDKYKRIRENVTLVSRDLKNAIERLCGQGDDLPQLAKDLVTYYDEQKEGSKELLTLQEKTRACKKERDTLIQELESLEAEYKKRQELITQQQLVCEKLAQERRNMDRSSRERRAIEEQLTSLPKNDISEDLIQLRKERSRQECEEQELQETIRQNAQNEAKAELLIKQAKERSDSVTNLENCPTCKQEVHNEHKQAILHDAKTKIMKIKERQDQIRKKREELEKKHGVLKEKIVGLRNKTEELLKEKSRSDLRKNYEKQHTQKKEEYEIAQKNVRDFEKREQELKKQLDEEYDTEAVRKHREKTRHAEEAFQKANAEQVRHEERQHGIEERVTAIEKSIAQKEQAVEKARRLEERRAWLTKHFSALMFTIEQQVLMTLYHQFNDAFKEWFDELIEDESISVRLDHDFSPLVEQNGYETEIDNLSGGEKTSVALAYRLALNKIINQALPHLNTDGLLILDEPTDGFSTEQLDRVQEVLSKLGLRQIVLVSHEPKMESFVDHVVRVVKSEHESRIA